MVETETARERELKNEDSYDGLVALIEASAGIFCPLIVACEPGKFQEEIIARYEAELQPEIPCYRAVLNQAEPSLRAALEELVREVAALRISGARAAITVTGTEALQDFPVQREGDRHSEIDRFFGYLQWTREGLRAFPFPLILWVTPQILERLSWQAPDFWSWRRGVFRFVPPPVETMAVNVSPRDGSPSVESESESDLDLDELLEQVGNLERQGKETAALATSYDRVGRAYSQQIELRQAEDVAAAGERAISFFQKALALQEKLNLRAARIDTLVALADVYCNLQLWEEAFEPYQQALAMAKTLADRQEEANILVRLGNLYLNYPRGDRAGNVENAISCYNAALEVYTREAFPINWATTQNNLGTAYLYRIRGERRENLERAIASFNAALEVRTREAFPVNWATTQNNLGNAYLYRIRGERGENLERAIASYNAALEVYTREAFPVDWAMTQNNLGNAYADRIRGERAENLERAIASYNAALEVYTREAFPIDWATTQNNLGNAYADRIRGERAENLERAIASYNAALEVYTAEAFPREYAIVRENLERAESARDS